MRRRIFAGNWKMHKTPAESAALAKEIIAGAAGLKGRELILFPAALCALGVAELCRGSGIGVGVQNMYWEDEGAFTGEISPVMVKAAGCGYVILGHSERRHIFGENDDMVNKKLLAALKHGIAPVLCVGELLEEREHGLTESVIIRQLREGLAGAKPEDTEKLIIAYEPVWAIGTGKTATPQIAQEVHRLIRHTAAELVGQDRASRLPLLYGGSVKPENIRGLLAQDDIDGALVGGASLKADSFLAIAGAE